MCLQKKTTIHRYPSISAILRPTIQCIQMLLPLKAWTQFLLAVICSGDLCLSPAAARIASDVHHRIIAGRLDTRRFARHHGWFTILCLRQSFLSTRVWNVSFRQHFPIVFDLRFLGYVLDELARDWSPTGLHNTGGMEKYTTTWDLGVGSDEGFTPSQRDAWKTVHVFRSEVSSHNADMFWGQNTARS